MAMASCLMAACLNADVKSIDGRIKFQVTTGAQPNVEMMLTPEGLNIGSEATATANLSVTGNVVISQRLTIGEGGLSSTNLHLQGSFGVDPLISSSNIALSDHYLYFVDTSAQNLNLCLPPASENMGRVLMIKKTSKLNALYLHGNELINQSPDVCLEGSELGHVQLTSDGTQWYTLGMSGNSALSSAENLVGWWPLSETSGNTAFDKSINNNSGVLSGGFSFSNNTELRSKWSALSFDGSNDRLAIDGDANLNTPNQLTVMAWIYDEDGSTAHTINKDGGANRLWIIRRNSSTAVNWHVWNSAGTLKQFTPVNSWVEHQWFHIACTGKVVSGNIIMEVFFNGSSAGNTSFAGTAMKTNTAQDILFSNDVANYKQQKLDDVRIYNKALTEIEVEAIYQATR